MPPRIHPIHRIPSGIGIAVGPHARLGDLPPVGLEEHQKVGVVVPRVEILQPRLGALPLSHPAFGVFGCPGALGDLRGAGAGEDAPRGKGKHSVTKFPAILCVLALPLPRPRRMIYTET